MFKKTFQSRTKEYADQIETNVQNKEWEERQVKKDALRFEEVVRQARIRLGLEGAIC